MQLSIGNPFLESARYIIRSAIINKQISLYAILVQSYMIIIIVTP